jgi:ankyrin repeat protein
MVSILLAKIKEPLAGDCSDKRTALHLAANIGREDTLIALLNNEIISNNINILDGNQRTALHALAMAASRSASREKAIDLLFEKGIDFNARDVNANTALDIAEARAIPKIFQFAGRQI